MGLYGMLISMSCDFGIAAPGNLLPHDIHVLHSRITYIWVFVSGQIHHRWNWTVHPILYVYT